ncbi:restriction endonuclease subunit S [Streptomyces sp. DT24]|uniref:restriction endonuclease subunit S n=1 Tax=unclassified Streptomyces TaxID=2593676 RepID=UPI0023B96D30|nr:restriction endonuclease subunit S [Streptomyces sp. AM 4-1-1]WEH36081.1 restriction endonuclease subunit S [Streptomyces sp. AM 4-1-1]
MNPPAVVRLGDHVSFLSGFAFKSSFFNTDGDGLPVVRIRDVKSGRSSTFYSGDYDPDFIVCDGDQLIGMDGEFSLAPWRGGKALLNQRVCKIVNTSDLLDTGYLVGFLPAVLKEIEDATPYATVKHLSVKTLREIEVPLPPLAEQRRVAAVLDRVDALRTGRREAIALLDDLARSVFLDMFGDPLANPRGWDRSKMKEFLLRVDSGKSPKCLDRPAGPGEWGVLKLGAVTRCVFVPGENKALPSGSVPDTRHEVAAGDLLLSRKNTPDLVAACAYVRSTPERLLMPDLVFRLVVADGAPVNKVYLHGLLTFPPKRRRLQELASGSAASMLNISKAKLLEFECEIPPIGLQEEFARRIEAIEACKVTHRAQLAALDELFASLRHRAFSGRLWDREAA